MRQQVRDLLNKVPHFSYRAVEVDGLSVGVYEIMPGGRPYFPLRDVEPALQKHVAKYRDEVRKANVTLFGELPPL